MRFSESPTSTLPITPYYSAIHEVGCQPVADGSSRTFKVSIYTESAYVAMQALAQEQPGSLLSGQFYLDPPLYTSGGINAFTPVLWRQFTAESALVVAVESLTRPSLVCSAPYDVRDCRRVRITLGENPLGVAIETIGDLTYRGFHPFEVREMPVLPSSFDLPAEVPDGLFSEEGYSIPESRSVSVPHTVISRSDSSRSSMQLSSIEEASEESESSLGVESPGSSRVPSVVEAG